MNTSSSQPLLDQNGGNKAGENQPGFFAAASSAHLLEMAVNAVSAGIIITDCSQPDNPVVYVNPGFERLTGYTAAEVLGRNCRFLQGSAVDQPETVRLREAISAGQAVTVVLRNYRKDGTSFYNELAISPVHDQHNRRTHFIGIQTDVTARVEAEEARRIGEERYRKLINGFPNGAVLMFDKDLRYFVVEGAAIIRGNSREVLLNKRIRDSLPPETYDILAPPYQAALRGESSTIEMMYGDRNYLLHVAPLENDPAASSAGMVIVQDVTELKRAQSLTRQLEQQLTVTLESMHDGFFGLDKDWRFTYLNTGAEKLLNYPRYELIQQVIWDKFPELAGTTFERMYRQVMTEHTPVHFEEYYPPTNTWYEIKAYPTGENGLNVYCRDITAHKEAELQLLHNEQRFRVLIENSSELISMIGAEGQVRYLSPSVKTIMGYSEEELTGRNNLDFIHPEDVPHLLSRQQLLVSQPGMRQQNEFRFRHRDGSWHYMEIDSRNLLHVPGIEAIVVNGHDVTARKQVELALRHSEEMLNFALEAARVGTWDYDLKTRHIEWSNKVENLLGFKPGNFYQTYQTLKKRIWPADRKVLLQTVVKPVEPGSEYHLEFRLVNPDKQVLWVEWRGRAYYDQAGQSVKISGVVQDITRRKQTEAALQESEARLAGIINSATDGIITLDSHQRVVVFNAAAEAMFGWAAREVHGQSLERFFPRRYHTFPGDYVTLFDPNHLLPAKSSGHTLIPLTALRRNGEEFPVEATISQLAMAEQHYYTVIIRDVSERKAAEEALAKSEAQLRQSQKMEAVGQLAGGIAHDFNNLLTVIVGYSEIILANLTRLDPLYEDMNEILEAAQRATNVTRQLLAFSRQQVLQPSLLDLNEVVEEMNRMLRRLIGENIELVTLRGEQLAPVRADRGQLEQVLVNLAVNARDAMPGGGKLIFQTSTTTLTAVDIGYLSELTPGDYVRLDVTDTGQGMTETVKSRLFEPFFTTKERGRGTGLGLSMVYGIVKQSGGYIEVQSKPGQGSTFKIYLPVAGDAGLQRRLPDQHDKVLPGVPRVQHTVLLVEDEDGVRHLAERILAQYGYKVMSARHGGEALLLCESYNGRIDLLITDMVMPQMGGPKLRERLAPLQPEMEVLYMSGYADQLLVEQSRLNQPETLPNFLPKPFTPHSLASKVRELLDLKKDPKI